MSLIYQPVVEKLSIQRILADEGVNSSAFSLSEITAELIRKPFGLIGVIASKMVKNWKSQNGTSVYYLSDLKGVTSTLSLKNVSQRIFSDDSCEGTVVLIIKPELTIDSQGKLEVSVHAQKQVLVIGHIKSFGRCNALKKDGVTFCKMPVDKSHGEHCVYHNYDCKEGVKKWSPPASLAQKLNITAKPDAQISYDTQPSSHSSSFNTLASTPSHSTMNATDTPSTSASSEYKRMNVSLPSSLTHHGNTCNQVVSMDILPLGSRPKIGAITSVIASGDAHFKRTLTAAGADHSQQISAGDGGPNKRVCTTTKPDLLTMALNKVLTVSATPNTTNKTTTSITSSHLKEVQRGGAGNSVDQRGMHNLHTNSGNGEVTAVDEDLTDHQYALRQHSDSVNLLLGVNNGSNNTNNNTINSFGSRPDAMELKTIRNIIANETQRRQQQQGINNIINNNNTARVPAPSNSVFAIGAEMYKQQLIEKENTLQNKLQSINRNNGLNNNVPVRAVSTLTSKLTAGLNNNTKTNINTMNNNSNNNNNTQNTQGNKLTVSSDGVNKILRPASAPNITNTYTITSNNTSNNSLLNRGSMNNTQSNANSLKMVGKTLVNTANLTSNANSTTNTAKLTQSVAKGNLVTQIIAHVNNKTSSNNTTTSSNQHLTNTNTANTAAAVEKVKQKTALDSTIDALLSRKSLNAGSANDEWFESYTARMNKLAQREYAQEKASSVHSIHIKAFQCLDCNLCTETSPPLCRQHQHNVKLVTTTKQFFECGGCSRRDYTLGKGSVKVSLPPDNRCTACGAYNWKACGSRGSGPLSVTAKDHRQSLNGGQLVLTASEGASRADVITMAAKTSALL